MSEKPLVTAIIPFYNTPENFLKEAIESIFAQSFKSWEILLVDDGSTGKCVSVAKQYAKKYSGIVHYFEHELHRLNLLLTYKAGGRMMGPSDTKLEKRLEEFGNRGLEWLLQYVAAD